MDQATQYSVVFSDYFGSVFGPFRSLHTAVTFALAESTAEHRAIVIAS